MNNGKDERQDEGVDTQEIGAPRMGGSASKQRYRSLYDALLPYYHMQGRCAGFVEGRWANMRSCYCACCGQAVNVCQMVSRWFATTRCDLSGCWFRCHRLRLPLRRGEVKYYDRSTSGCAWQRHAVYWDGGLSDQNSDARRALDSIYGRGSFRISAALDRMWCSILWLSSR